MACLVVLHSVNMARNQPRKTAILVLVVATLVAAVGAVAQIVPANAAGGLPDTFQLAPRHGGDEGRWNTTSTQSGAQPATTSEPASSNPSGTIVAAGSMSTGTASRESFEWLPAQAWRAGDGSWHAVHGLLRVDPDHGDTATVNGHVVFTPGWQVDWTETSTGRVLGTSALTGGSAQASQDLELTTDSSTTTWAEQDSECSLADALQKGVSLHDEIQSQGCPQATETYRAVRVETINGIEAVRFDSVQRPVSYWFNPGIPYPLQTRSQSKDVVTERHLVAFKAGTEAWDARVELPRQTALPAIQLADRKPWGPDDSGVVHPFALSVAWQKAAQDQTNVAFRQFLAAHPKAAATSAEYSEVHQGSNIDREWDVLVLDGNASFFLTAIQHSKPVDGALADLLGRPAVGPAQDSYDFKGGSGAAHGFAATDELTRQLPTVASALAFWKAFTGSPAPGNAWGLDYCPACDGKLSMTAGNDTLVLPVASLIAPAANATFSHTMTEFAGNGTLLSLQESEATYIHTTTQSLGVLAGFPPTSRVVERQAGGPRVAALGIELPISATLGVGGVTALVAIVLWLWPAIKGLPALGLFSRVTGDQLLEHPMRADLMRRIEAEPGVHYQSLLRATGAGKGGLEHHLRKLEEGRLVRAVRGSRYTCYFPWAASQSVRAAAPALKSEGARRILEAVQRKPGITGHEVALQTGLSPSSVSEHVARLAAAGLVSPSREGRVQRLQATHAASQAAGAAA
jgi:DNA-binding transcriptional ArsR family regulator